MERIRRQLDALSVAYERIDAVDGSRLAKVERRSAASAFRWWCAKGYLPRPGEIGCGLSHREVWRKIAGGNDACACVLEDDVTLERGFVGMLGKAERFLCDGTKPRVVLLTPVHGEFLGEFAAGGFGKIGWAMYTGGYVVTRESARRLLCTTSPLTAPVDEWRRWVKLAKIDLFAADPAACTQAEYGSEPWGSPMESDTRERGFVFVKDMSVARRMAYKAFRIIGKTFDFIFTRVAAK
jgi:glycosyl transferase family 25